MLNKYFIFNPWEWHHLYTGILLMGAGIFFGDSIFCIILRYVGFWLIVDDIGQHRLQRVFDDPNYHSYGHYIGKPFYQLRRYLVNKYGWDWLNEL